MISIYLSIIGTWILQDALASIAFYPKENWCWNHAARLIRAIMGIVLIVIAIIMKE